MVREQPEAYGTGKDGMEGRLDELQQQHRAVMEARGRDVGAGERANAAKEPTRHERQQRERNARAVRGRPGLGGGARIDLGSEAVGSDRQGGWRQREEGADIRERKGHGEGGEEDMQVDAGERYDEEGREGGEGTGGRHDGEGEGGMHSNDGQGERDRSRRWRGQRGKGGLWACAAGRGGRHTEYWMALAGLRALQ